MQTKNENSQDLNETIHEMNRLSEKLINSIQKETAPSELAHLEEFYKKLHSFLVPDMVIKEDLYLAITIFYKKSATLMVLLFSKNFINEGISLAQASIELVKKIGSCCSIESMQNQKKQVRRVRAYETLVKIITLEASIANALREKKQAREAKKYFKSAYNNLQRLSAIPKLPFKISKISDPFSAQYYPLMARLAIIQNNLRSAIKYTALGYSFYENCQSLTSQCHYVAAVNLFNTYCQIGHHYYQKGNFEQSANWYESALELSVEMKDLLKNEKVCYIQLDNLELQIAKSEDQLKIIQQSASFIEACLNKAKIAINNTNTSFLIEQLKECQIFLSPMSKEGETTPIFDLKKITNVSNLEEILVRSKIGYVIIHNEGISSNTIQINAFDINKLYLSKIITLLQQKNVSEMPLKIFERNSQSQIGSLETKEEKKLRHEIAQEDKSKQIAKDSSQEKKEENVQNKKIELKWLSENKQFSNDISAYYRVYGRPSLITFSFFNKDVFEQVPSYYVIEKAKQVAEKGKVLTNANTKGKQGYVFFKQDKKLSKYGKDYICKLKIKGEAGDHRFLGKKIATGSLNKINGNEIESHKCELIEFDKFVNKAHR